MHINDIIEILADDYKKSLQKLPDLYHPNNEKLTKQYFDSGKFNQDFELRKKIEKENDQKFQDLNLNFKKELFKYLGIENHSKAELIWSLSNKYHEIPYDFDEQLYGLLNIAQVATDLVQLIK